MNVCQFNYFDYLLIHISLFMCETSISFDLENVFFKFSFISKMY